MCVAVNSRLMTIDEAKKKRGKFVSDEEFEKMVEERSKELYGYLRTLEFSWKKQEDSETGKVEMKLMSRLPNGKLVFLDKYEDIDSVLPGVPYICTVYEIENVAFAKIVCEEYEPKIFILPNRLVHEVWRDKKGHVRRRAPHGNSYAERIVASIKAMEERGFPSIRIIFKGNERED